MPHMSEKRKFARLPIRIFVKWRKSSLGEQWESLDAIRNISRGGICFATTHQLKKGDIVEIELKLPPKRIIKSQGKITWVKEVNLYELDKDLEFEVGVEFIDIKPEDREELSKFVLEHFTSP